jgi:hypothetical protein
MPLVAEDGTGTISKEMETVPVRAVHRIEVRDKHGNSFKATLDIRYRNGIQNGL